MNCNFLQFLHFVQNHETFSSTTNGDPQAIQASSISTTSCGRTSRCASWRRVKRGEQKRCSANDDLKMDAIGSFVGRYTILGDGGFNCLIVFFYPENWGRFPNLSNMFQMR